MQRVRYMMWSESRGMARMYMMQRGSHLLSCSHGAPCWCSWHCLFGYVSQSHSYD